MPVFLVLALVTGPPLNVIPDECPNLPPLRNCADKFNFACSLWKPLEEEACFREFYDPSQDSDAMRSLRMKDPAVLRKWRTEARQAADQAKEVARFWMFAEIAQRSTYDPEQRAFGIQYCRHHLGEALWQKGGWWK
jgi:hypothetical protein